MKIVVPSTLKNQKASKSEPLDEASWEELCDKLAKKANRGCGLSYTMFLSKVSYSIEDEVLRLPEGQRQKAYEIAKKYGYATPEEVDAEIEYGLNNGCCVHGIQLGCCPAGCDSD